METAQKYSSAVFWSEDDREYVAICLEIPDLSALGTTRECALAELQTAIHGWIEYLQKEGLPLPEPEGNGVILVVPGRDFTFSLPGALGGQASKAAVETEHKGDSVRFPSYEPRLVTGFSENDERETAN